MESQVAVDLCRDAALTSLVVGGPLLLVAMLVGLLIGLLQALTQIQDQTVSFVPKLLAMIAVLIFCLPWLLQQMISYSQNVIRDIPQVIVGG